MDNCGCAPGSPFASEGFLGVTISNKYRTGIIRILGFTLLLGVPLTGNWEIKEVRHGTVAPGEGPVGPDGKVVDLSKLNVPRGETPPASSTPKPKTMPLSPDQAPHLQQ